MVMIHRDTQGNDTHDNHTRTLSPSRQWRRGVIRWRSILIGTSCNATQDTSALIGTSCNATQDTSTLIGTSCNATQGISPLMFGIITPAVGCGRGRRYPRLPSPPSTENSELSKLPTGQNIASHSWPIDTSFVCQNNNNNI